MNIENMKEMLEKLREGTVSVDDALHGLRMLPFEEIDNATIDTHRSLRSGFPEVVFGKGKSSAQIKEICGRMVQGGENVLVTRLDKDKAIVILENFPEAAYNELAGTVFIQRNDIKRCGMGTILVISAGTSDISVAEEAAVTAQVMGNKVERAYDVGVAGIHRLFAKREQIIASHVLIVVAGMEGALPSVVSGLVSRPVIAVPTSVGYGANLAGFTPLLAMLNSCSAGVTVVNIDNGFGAGYAASLMNRRL